MLPSLVQHADWSTSSEKPWMAKATLENGVYQVDLPVPVTRRENLAHAFRAIDVGLEEVTEHWYDQLFLVSHDVAFTEITDQIIQIVE